MNSTENSAFHKLMDAMQRNDLSQVGDAEIIWGAAVAYTHARQWLPISEAPRDGLFWCYCPTTPPQSSKQQAVRVRDGEWLTSWQPTHFQFLPDAPPTETGAK